MLPRRGWPIAAALSAFASAATADVLSVETEGATLVSVEVADGAEWCLKWQHSVTGGDVADCFRNDGGTMILDRSFLHDFAAGLGTIAGRGWMRTAEGGGYWIEDMDEPVAENRLILRVGRGSVDHRLVVAGDVHDLTAMAAGERVSLRLDRTP
ncbi:DUF1850 domain-containing protein [Roseitranquillus sediminis]|uniref:DUF1850 domain-containing protein n=1 Tax=Roseitranquillus sediminis TaxID=2809051 RepID=UPI001D0C2400|nr:DUF1850 domain-containing protein [Roseitranquillus sediminis]MBM9593961.1 DUF1850 domain-containing protein [Roseitranquillus sediminis]